MYVDLAAGSITHFVGSFTHTVMVCFPAPARPGHAYPGCTWFDQKWTGCAEKITPLSG